MGVKIAHQIFVSYTLGKLSNLELSMRKLLGELLKCHLGL